jgi:HK97 family phage prohead protease
MSYLGMIANAPARTVKFATGGGKGTALLHKTVSPGVIRQVDSRTVKAVISDGRVDRAGEIVEPAGAILDGYLQNPVVCAFHDTTKPIARCTDIAVRSGRLEATITFPPPGTSAVADEICGLIKSGTLSGWSVGFNPIETVPMSAADPRGPKRYTKWELYEVSAVAVPCNPGAVVVERSYRSAETTAFAMTDAHWAHGIRADLERRALQYARAAYSAQQTGPMTRAELLAEVERRRK